MDDSIDVLFVCVSGMQRNRSKNVLLWIRCKKKWLLLEENVFMFLRKWTMYDYSILCSH